MKEEVVSFILSDREQLIKQLVESGYAFAAWRLPNEQDQHLVISLKEPIQTDVSFLEMDTGFVMNRFDNNHPVNPYFIAADILIKGEQITIDPRVKDAEIDQFKTAIAAAQAHSSKGTLSVFSGEFETSVSDAVNEISNHSFEKVVLSRFLEEDLPNDFSPWKFFEKVCNQYLNAFCSIAFIPGMGLWIGATPELLISDNAQRFKTIALAGTKKLEEDQSLSEIAWTQKEIEEQALVSRYIINCFKKIRLREFHEHGPKTVKAGSLAHLKTEFEVLYDEVNFENLADQMIELLHPTSAVCGMPIEQTKPFILAQEQYDRSFYAGFLGPVNFDASTNLFVNLRCMRIQDGIVRFYAGAGITEDSDPHKEYMETEMKMNVLKNLF